MPHPLQKVNGFKRFRQVTQTGLGGSELETSQPCSYGLSTEAHQVLPNAKQVTCMLARQSLTNRQIIL